MKEKIIKLIGKGKTYRQVAKELGLKSPSTISYYLNKKPRVSRKIVCPRCGGSGACDRFVGDCSNE